MLMQFTVKVKFLFKHKAGDQNCMFASPLINVQVQMLHLLHSSGPSGRVLSDMLMCKLPSYIPSRTMVCYVLADASCFFKTN